MDDPCPVHACFGCWRSGRCWRHRDSLILLSALIIGGGAGWGIARWQGRTWYPPVLIYLALALIGFLPQWLAFFFPPINRSITDEMASAGLVLSQILLLLFTWLNCTIPSMRVLMVGLGCNLLVIAANGGFMPLPLETAEGLISHEALDNLVIGGRISYASKDASFLRLPSGCPGLRIVFPRPYPSISICLQHR